MPQCSRWQSFERGFRLIGGSATVDRKKFKDGTTHRFESYFERDQYDTMDGNNDYDEDAGWKLDGMQRGPAIEYCCGLSRLAITAENVTALDESFIYAYRVLIRHYVVGGVLR